MNRAENATAIGKGGGGVLPLFRKEVRQLLHKPGAVASAVLFPLLFLVIMPGAMAFFGSMGMPVSPMGGVPMPPGLADLSTGNPGLMLRDFNLPLFVALVGVFEPAFLAVYTIVSEKEKKTIDLLLALPLSLVDIISSKLVAIVAVSLAVTLPLLVADFVILAVMGALEVIYVLGFVFLLFTALMFSTSVAMTLGLAAKDYRTANNLSGILMGPLILVMLGILIVLPMGVYRMFLLGGLLLALCLAVTFVGVKRYTLERLAV